jgi:hypothetical protein
MFVNTKQFGINYWITTSMCQDIYRVIQSFLTIFKEVEEKTLRRKFKLVSTDLPPFRSYDVFTLVSSLLL